MKKLTLLFILLIMSFNGFAQDEFKNKFKAIPAKNSNIKTVIPPKVISPKVAPPAVVKTPIDDFVNPEDIFLNGALYKKESNTSGVFYRRNQFLGSFKTKTFTSTIRYKDAAFVDGDKIRVYLNDKIIESEVVLDGAFQGFKITLVEGTNKIDFEALNEGFASPNTAEFQVYDDKGVAISASQWNVGIGYKATIVLVKE